MSKFCVKAAILFSLAIAEQSIAEQRITEQPEAEQVSTTAKPVTTQGGTSEILSVSVSTPAPGASQEKTFFEKASKKIRNVGNKVGNPLEFVKSQAKIVFEKTLDNLNDIDESGGMPGAEMKTLYNISSNIEPILSILGHLSPKFDEAAKTINLFKEKVKEYKDDAKDKKDEFVLVFKEKIKDQLNAALTKLKTFQSTTKHHAKKFVNEIKPLMDIGKIIFDKPNNSEDSD